MHFKILQLLVHGLSLTWLGWVYYLGFSDQLGGDPVEGIIHYTGKGALHLLMLTLLVAPLSRWLGQPRLIRLRRPIGLYSALWAVAHISNYVIFDLQFDWPLIASELVQRPYIIVGLTALLILLVLAVTSLPRLVRKLGRRWRTVHSGIYLALVLACVHFWWSVKGFELEPLIYGLAAVVLLSFKRRPLWRLAVRVHKTLTA